MSCISLLRKGDEIVLRKGFGGPRCSSNSKKIIADAVFSFAVTTDGTILTPADSPGIIITGKSFPDFEIDNAAKKIIREVMKGK
jgi:hypothetical protein